MVSVAIIDGHLNSALQAAHIGIRVPIKIRQFARKAELVGAFVSGHLCPVEPAYVLTPTKNLTDKTFNCINWGITCVITLLGGFADLMGRQQTYVHRR